MSEYHACNADELINLVQGKDYDRSKRVVQAYLLTKYPFWYSLAAGHGRATGLPSQGTSPAKKEKINQQLSEKYTPKPIWQAFKIAALSVVTVPFHMIGYGSFGVLGVLSRTIPVLAVAGLAQSFGAPHAFLTVFNALGAFGVIVGSAAGIKPGFEAAREQVLNVPSSLAFYHDITKQLICDGEKRQDGDARWRVARAIEAFADENRSIDDLRWGFNSRRSDEGCGMVKPFVINGLSQLDSKSLRLVFSKLEEIEQLISKRNNAVSKKPKMALSY